MNTLLKFLGLIIVLLVIVVSGGLAYHGFFQPVTVEEKEMGPYTVVYKEHLGAYTGVGPTMDKVYAALEELNLGPLLGVGLFFDDPATTPEAELRSEVGVLLQGKQLEMVEEIESRFNGQGIFVKEIKAAPSMTAEFPYKTMLSYMLGPIKVYPAFQAHSEANSYTADTEDGFAIEIYDLPQRKTVFVIPIPN